MVTTVTIKVARGDQMDCKLTGFPSVHWLNWV